jgi:uncharacterized membrane protein YdjX (TVP38/TMEM64 family)
MAEIDILPPDPQWRPPHAPPPRTYDAGEVRAGAVHLAEPEGDPRVVQRLLASGLTFALLAVLTVGLVWWLEPFGPRPLADAAAALHGTPWWGPTLVVLGIATLVPLLVPVGGLAVLPGYLWGGVAGTAVGLAGALLGGLVNWALGKRLVGRHVRAWAQRNPVVAGLLGAIQARGLRLVLAVRLSPVVPYGILAYLSGIAGLSAWRFALASVLGGVPWTAVYAIAGALLAESSRPVSLGDAQVPHAGLLRWLGLGVTVVVASWIGGLVRREVLGAATERAATERADSARAR